MATVHGIGLASAIRKLRRQYWYDTLQGIKRGTTIRVTAQCFPEQTPWTTEYTFEYVNKSHVHCTTENGVSVGEPTCFILDVEVVGHNDSGYCTAVYAITHQRCTLPAGHSGDHAAYRASWSNEYNKGAGFDG